MPDTLLFLNMGGYEVLLLLFFLIIPVGIWLWALVDLLRSNFTNQINKLIWLILIVFLPILGVPLYYFLAEGQKVQH